MLVLWGLLLTGLVEEVVLDGSQDEAKSEACGSNDDEFLGLVVHFIFGP